MIKQYNLTLSCDKGNEFSSNMAYQLYGGLLKKMDFDYSTKLHEQSITPISQSLLKSEIDNQATWQINIFGDEAIEKFSPIIDDSLEYQINPLNMNVCVESKSFLQLNSFKDVIKGAEIYEDKKFYRFQFNTTTSFKSDGNYVIFPTSDLILKSIMNKWNEFSKDYILEDEYAINEIIKGCRITGYKLASRQYKMKNTLIPGFVGYADITPHLALPLKEVVNSMLYFANFSGMGIKTSLGMGKVSIT